MSYQNYNQNPYSQSPSTEAGYGGGYNQQEQHEMQPYSQQEAPAPPPPVSYAMAQQDFLAQVQFTRGEIRQLTADVQSISALHQRALQGDDSTAQRQLDALVDRTQQRNSAIRSQIKTLKSDVEQTQDPGLHAMKRRHWGSLNDDFKAELQGYMAEEQRYSAAYREQIARQYRIANPSATDEEVHNAANQDWSQEGVFQQALSNDNIRRAQGTMGAVRARHNELKKIEQSMVELAALFQELDTMVLQQEPVVARAEEQTDNTVQQLKQGNTEVKKSVTLAKHRRKLKWWCFGVSVLIVIAIAVGVGVGVTVARGATGNNNNNNGGGNNNNGNNQ